MNKDQQSMALSRIAALKIRVQSRLEDSGMETERLGQCTKRSAYIHTVTALWRLQVASDN